MCKIPVTAFVLTDIGRTILPVCKDGGITVNEQTFEGHERFWNAAGSH